MSSPVRPSSALEAGMIDMESNTTLVQQYPAHRAALAGEGPFPAVLVLHDRFGLNANVKSVTNRLARLGFYAIAPDFYAMPSSFASTAPDLLRPTRSTFFDYRDETSARERAATLSDERAGAILERAFAYLAGRSKARPGGRGLLGFGTGGRLAFLGASLFAGDVAAAVCFYPEGLASARHAGSAQGAPLDKAEALAAPVRIFYGLLDMAIRPEEREAVRRRLAGLSKDFRIEIFPEAGHDFFCEDRETYRIHASKVAWEETVALFRRELGAGMPDSGASPKR